MRGRQIGVFMTKGDWEPILDTLENKYSLIYVENRNFKKAESISVYHSYKDIGDFGFPIAPDWIVSQSYLVSCAPYQFKFRPISTKKDGDILSPDTKENLRVVSFSPGGVWDDSIVIAGRVEAPLESTEDADRLYKSICQGIKSKCERVKSFWIGRAAVTMLDAGHRLVTSAKRDPIYDLSRT